MPTFIVVDNNIITPKNYSLKIMVNGNEKIVSTGTDYSWMMSQAVGRLAPENLTTALALSYLIGQGAPMPYGSWITNMIRDGWYALESTCSFGGIPSDALNTNRIEKLYSQAHISQQLSDMSNFNKRFSR